METRTLKNTDLEVSRICFGTMTLGGQVDEAAAFEIIDRCFDAGINFFDTANVYTQGRSEEILGRAFKGRRQQIILASKVRGGTGLSPAAMRTALDDTLRRLGTDYLDLYYLHAPDYDVPVEESLATMDEFVRAGKVRYPATSNYASWQLCDMLWIAKERGFKPSFISQPMYNLLARGIEQEFLPMAKQFGVSTVVYNPLAGGLLTGKQRAAAPAPGSRFDNNQMYLDRYWHPAYFEAVEKLRAIATKASCSLVSLSLNWLLHHSPIDCVILGASRLEQLDANLRTLKDGPLPADTLKACDEVWQELRGVTPKYNR